MSKYARNCSSSPAQLTEACRHMLTGTCSKDGGVRSLEGILDLAQTMAGTQPHHQGG